MRGALLAAILVSSLCATSVWADVSPQPPPSGTAKLADGRGNNCATKYYPASAIQMNEEGDTVVKLYIDPNGIVTNVDVEKSSGYPDLDQASVDCVATAWHFSPATSNGEPVASTKEYRIVWRLTGSFEPRLRTTDLNFCQGDLQHKDQWNYAGKDAVLKYRVMPDGHVQDLFVIASSRDSSFDIFAARCVSQLSYAPITDMPAGISWGGEVVGGTSGIFFGDGHGVWHSCSDDPQVTPTKDAHDLSVTISYRIIPGGSTAAVTVEQSSGDTVFDQSAQTCVQKWRYGDRLLVGPDLNTKMHAHIVQKNTHLYVFEYLAD